MLVVFVVLVVDDAVVEVLFAFDEVVESTSILQAEKMVIDTKKNKVSFFIILMLRLNFLLILKKQKTDCKTLFSAYKSLINFCSFLLRLFSSWLRLL